MHLKLNALGEYGDRYFILIYPNFDELFYGAVSSQPNLVQPICQDEYTHVLGVF